MELAMHRTKILAIDVRIDLGRRDVGVSKHLLHSAQVGTSLEQMRGERMPESVR